MAKSSNSIRKWGEIIVFYFFNAIDRRKTKTVKFPVKTRWMFIPHHDSWYVYIFLKNLNSCVIYTCLFISLSLYLSIIYHHHRLLYLYNLPSFSSYPSLIQHKRVYYIYFGNGKFRLFWLAFLASVNQGTWEFWNKKIS